MFFFKKLFIKGLTGQNTIVEKKRFHPNMPGGWGKGDGGGGGGSN